MSDRYDLTPEARTNLISLAHLIEQEAKEKFSMYHYFHPCGSPMCMAGWTFEMFNRSANELNGSSTRFVAATSLGIPVDLGKMLFTPHEMIIIHVGDEKRIYKVYEITHIGAGKLLRHLAATGILDWTVSDAPFIVRPPDQDQS